MKTSRKKADVFTIEENSNPPQASIPNKLSDNLHSIETSWSGENTGKPAYSLGKVKSKYLILEIFSYTGHAQSTNPYMWQVNHNLRDLLIKNYRIINSILRYRPCINHGFARIAQE